MLAQINRVNCQEFNDLFVEEICLEDVSIEDDAIKFVYSFDLFNTNHKYNLRCYQFRFHPRKPIVMAHT
ncbi:hypothetical protein BJP36_14820 [Moorena producens JHB]|uniref:Uncharacterized protein n=1 Tax=Moorena producens (strain JHB) TaxID=1454205 RepID=A0A1D9G043_MOOP1|nr:MULTISPECIES: hypothetical protein [Moorena]AOY80987.1 hypothetical protein BJP36_14820 [Moorena producens JHB]NEQ05693.1 hypothetical protein [Moorena sp. SIO4E2]